MNKDMLGQLMDEIIEQKGDQVSFIKGMWCLGPGSMLLPPEGLLCERKYTGRQLLLVFHKSRNT